MASYKAKSVRVTSSITISQQLREVNSTVARTFNYSKCQRANVLVKTCTHLSRDVALKLSNLGGQVQAISQSYKV